MNEGESKELESHHSAILVADWLQAVKSVAANFTKEGKTCHISLLLGTPYHHP